MTQNSKRSHGRWWSICWWNLCKLLHGWKQFCAALVILQLLQRVEGWVDLNKGISGAIVFALQFGLKVRKLSSSLDSSLMSLLILSNICVHMQYWILTIRFIAEQFPRIGASVLLLLTWEAVFSVAVIATHRLLANRCNGKGCHHLLHCFFADGLQHLFPAPPLPVRPGLLWCVVQRFWDRQWDFMCSLSRLWALIICAAFSNACCWAASASFLVCGGSCSRQNILVGDCVTAPAFVLARKWSPFNPDWRSVDNHEACITLCHIWILSASYRGFHCFYSSWDQETIFWWHASIGSSVRINCGSAWMSLAQTWSKLVLSTDLLYLPILVRFCNGIISPTPANYPIHGRRRYIISAVLFWRITTIDVAWRWVWNWIVLSLISNWVFLPPQHWMWH